METWKPTSRPMTYAEWLESGANIDRLVIHFWAVWNNYDRQTDLALQEAFDSFYIDIEWRSWDTDQKDGRDWVRSTGLQTIPSVAGFSYGKLVGLQQGYQTAQSYRVLFKEWFGPCHPA